MWAWVAGLGAAEVAAHCGLPEKLWIRFSLGDALDPLDGDKNFGGAPILQPV
jgi:hypothetical protein